MKHLPLILATHFFLFIFSGKAISKESKQVLHLYFDKPATCWEETLPLGNGRIGMMIDGAIDMEEVILNDITMWSGSVDLETINPNAKE
jgi:alpha-L-fucosidase 2